MFLITHAFSRQNAGDGLLVDLTYEALADAGIEGDECALLALDAPSFSDLQRVYQAPGEARGRPSFRLLRPAVELLSDAAAAMLGRKHGFGSVARLFERAEGIISVGGGYLVADSTTRKFGVMFNHLLQLRAAARCALPTVYLPQSIGPLEGVVGHWTRSALKRIDRVYVRDNQSLAELDFPNVARCSDLAILKLARELSSIEFADQGGGIILVGRELPNAGDYEDRLLALHQQLPGSRWAVQADVSGPRSDRHFYRTLGLSDAGTLAQLTEARTADTVVSVRLHGAIGALLSGRPAIHLAYERKGWGAYEDLGLQDYVHDARSFDVPTVVQKVQALQSDPEPFWSRVRAAAPALQSQYDQMIAELAQRLRRR
ncbi:polysaccharide pyruvyl transferase family protein [Nitratireductor sp. XY-223]|uniref:polysaccharide pyruvyl transferase family protein n=1 Tax=Nitratireductor sp. XY-223 TaxID=2561926 RepID=UPI0010A9B9F4|nr:polysaccharide pyruvyl transferase family protein [Nitratireductor sp. XY-223]